MPLNPTPGRAWPFKSSLPSQQKANADSLAAPAPVGAGEDTQVAALALAQFRKDFPLLAARLEAMRARVLRSDSMEFSE
jgi:hypothetical protein